MTAHGCSAFDPLEARTERQIGALLGRLTAPERDRLVSAMGTIETMTGSGPRTESGIILRQPRPGDLGWVVARHAELYAEMDGRNAGSVFLVKDSERIARLRLLLVDPAARGHGLGTRLTNECISFARECGYHGVTLWTHKVLTGARHIYQRAGFRLRSSERRRSFGKDVVSEHWDLALRPPPARRSIRKRPSRPTVSTSTRR